MKVVDAIGAQLDWMVAKIEESYPGQFTSIVLRAGEVNYRPSTDWSQGGPLLNQHKISRTIDHSGLWIAYAGYNLNDEQRHMQCDRSELVAGLRCLVALNLGEVVDVPEELCGGIK